MSDAPVVRTESPLSVLEIPPTLSVAVVKKAYFTLLPKHPPEADPAGFKRLRAAYEVLLHPGALEREYLAAPVDLDAVLLSTEAGVGAVLARARAEQRAARAGGQAVQMFVRAYSGMTFAEAVALQAASKSAS